MKQGWSVRVEGVTGPFLLPERIVEKLAEHHPAVSFGDSRVSVTLTVEALNPQQAIAFVLAKVSEVVRPLEVELVEAMTEDRQERELATSNLPDLVGLAEIAELAGTTRQRVFQMTANKGFPMALVELRSGRLWSRPAIENYLEGSAPRRRPIKTLTSQVGGGIVAASLRNKQRIGTKGR